MGNALMLKIVNETIAKLTVSDSTEAISIERFPPLKTTVVKHSLTPK
jgi:hypothetical protein